jgi:DNA-binding CsgD family transcriptional regulator
MEVYNGPHLIIKYEQDCSRLISAWKSSPPNDLEYRKELIEHLNIAQKIKPSQIIWLLESLSFEVGDVTKKWVDENISAPIFRAGFVGKNQDGFDQVAFIVGQDVLAYIEIMDIFKEKQSIGFKPKYFATEIECINWLSQNFNNNDSKSKEQKLSITFKGTDDDGKVVFEFKEDSTKFNSTINSFKTIIEQNHFTKNNVEKYSSLTPREIETLKLIMKGFTNEQIADKMNISKNTIRTHRNRIWKKLEIKHFNDCLKYKCFFN